MTIDRRLPVGAEVQSGRGVHFRVWTPKRRRVEVALESPPLAAALSAEADGYFSGLVAEARAGSRYRFRLDGGQAFPDPASRFQPEGPHGPSQVVDPAAFRWSDQAWQGVPTRGQVVYEIHVGTFTPEGTFDAAVRELPSLAELGVTTIELMPVADFPGRFGWGYDGVNLFAPTRLYGDEDGLRRFVDAAHGLRLAVVLDVVYNHLGPDGNYLPQYSDDYFTDGYETDWGKPINFDGERSGPVREYFVANAGYWIDEFHLDGLRLDATQNLYDASPEHVLTLIGRRVREAARGRGAWIVAENESQDVRLLKPETEGGHGLDAVWNDDLHHAAVVALTGRREAYYTDYTGGPQEFVSAARHGFLYQGQWYRWQKQRRGTPTQGLPAWRFVSFLENHDQVANSDRGLRLHRQASAGLLRALTAYVLLGPGTPMLFQGQEFASSKPFLYFADHEPELAAKVREGRRNFLAQFPSYARPEVAASLPHPADPATFDRCKLDHGERGRNPEAVALHRDLLQLRRDDPVLRRQGEGGLDGAVLGTGAFVLRWFGGRDDGDRLLVVNLGPDLELEVAPEPLLAPPAGRSWSVLFFSNDRRYGGAGGAPAAEPGDDGFWIPGECALLLAPREGRDEPRETGPQRGRVRRRVTAEEHV